MKLKFEFYIDAPGFSGSSAQQQKGTLQENVQIIECIGKAQDEFELKARRIVYFLPGRGPLEKSDGSIQEELKLLSHYFGKQVFDCVVVVATNPSKERYQ